MKYNKRIFYFNIADKNNDEISKAIVINNNNYPFTVNKYELYLVTFSFILYNI